MKLLCKWFGHKTEIRNFNATGNGNGPNRQYTYDITCVRCGHSHPVTTTSGEIMRQYCNAIDCLHTLAVSAMGATAGRIRDLERRVDTLERVSQPTPKINTDNLEEVEI